MHREVIKVGCGLVVDHINHNGLDNRKSNLRVATRWQNAQNRRKTSKRTASIYKGVSWNKRDKRWFAEIRVNDKCRDLGYFEDETAAAKAYDEAARKYHKPRKP